MDDSRSAKRRDRNASVQSSRAGLSFGKTIAFSLAPLVAIAALLEGAAWIADANFDFHDRVLEAFGLMTIDDHPIAPDEGFSFRSRIRIRSASPKRAQPTPYEVGGVTIEGADPSTKSIWASPDDLVRVGEKRIFVIGGSAAFGYPYAYEDTFAALLEERLGKPWRVLNAARVGKASGQLVRPAERIVEFYAPDILVIYSGNNEWIRWVPPQQPRMSQTRIRVLRPLLHSRALSSVVFWSLQRSSKRAGDADRFQTHRELSGISYALRFPADPASFDAQSWEATKREFLDAFEASLLRMIARARAAGVRVILLNVPFSHKLSPAWKHPQPEFFAAEQAGANRAAIRETERLLDHQRPHDALQRIGSALEHDPGPAVLHYLKAMSLEALGDLDGAEAAYARSREAMIGNLGSRDSINESIARVARESGAELVDLVALFDREQHALAGRFNEDLIHDDCHPTPFGHQIIATALHERLATSRRTPLATRLEGQRLEAEAP